MSTASIDLYSVASKNPLLAILRNIPLEDTLSFAQAVVDGGVRFFEVALNSPHGLEQIERLRNHFGGSCYIGAGTAITVEHCRRALAAGAQFLLTPGTPPDVFEYCASHALALLPGVLTPGDVSIALEYGYNTLKLFPAGSMPLRYVKDLKGPF